MSNVFNHFYEFGEFRVDPVRRLLLRRDEVIPVTPKVFDTLLVLLESGGRVLEKEELIRKVWAGVAVEEVGLTKNVSALRRALGEGPGEHRFIVTEPGRGYRFVASVKTAAASPKESPGNALGDGLVRSPGIFSSVDPAPLGCPAGQEIIEDRSSRSQPSRVSSPKKRWARAQFPACRPGLGRGGEEPPSCSAFSWRWAPESSFMSATGRR